MNTMVENGKKLFNSISKQKNISISNKKSRHYGGFYFDFSRARLQEGRSLCSLGEEREKVPGTGEVGRRRNDVGMGLCQAVGWDSTEGATLWSVYSVISM